MYVWMDGCMDGWMDGGMDGLGSSVLPILGFFPNAQSCGSGCPLTNPYLGGYFDLQGNGHVEEFP